MVTDTSLMKVAGSITQGFSRWTVTGSPPSTVTVTRLVDAEQVKGGRARQPELS